MHTILTIIVSVTLITTSQSFRHGKRGSKGGDDEFGELKAQEYDDEIYGNDDYSDSYKVSDDGGKDEYYQTPYFDEPIDRPSFNPHKAKYSKQVSSSQDYQETDDEDYNQSGEAPTIIDNTQRNNKHATDSKFEDENLEKEFDTIITEAVTDKIEKLIHDDLEAEEVDDIYEDITTEESDSEIEAETQFTETEEFLVSEEIDSLTTVLDEDSHPGYDIKNDSEIKDILNNNKKHSNDSFMSRMLNTNHLILGIVGFILAVVIVAVVSWFCFKNPANPKDYKKGEKSGSDV